ncbi:MAG TPA: S9 family peptidase [Verrucomicrobiae bacterium]|nr:S9 family peptidase [Verrucomicrobiae bacterium]
MDKRQILFRVALLHLVFIAEPIRAELPPLIPRSLLLGNPERWGPKLSPDGSRIAWIAPDTNNVLQVWLRNLADGKERAVTASTKRGVRQFFWAKNNRTLLYAQDSDGDENHHIFGVDLESGNVRDYTPFQGVRVDSVDSGENLDLNQKFPETLLLALNLRNRALFDFYRVNLVTGAVELDTENPGDVASWTVDPKMRVRLARVSTPNGGTELRVRADRGSPWRTFLKVGPDEILDVISFTDDGKGLYLRSSVGRDTAALVQKDLRSGIERVLAASETVDAGEIMVEPRSHVVEAVSFSPGRKSWEVVDFSVSGDFKALSKMSEGDISVVSRTDANDRWIVSFSSGKMPPQYYQWDRKSKSGSFLFTTRPKLKELALAEMKPVVIKARDGLNLHGYLSLPAGVPPRRLPMILLPHGGPYQRDDFDFNPRVQWLANRGYAVLQPNFRGSTGYGKKFLYAGNKQWGRKMQDDLIDCVQWAVNEGIADPKRVGIMGGSYGGYCVLAALAFTPEVFACGVDMFGPSDLRTLMGSFPVYWKAYRSMLAARVGDVDDPRDAELIYNASPIHFTDRINRPLLIGQGANDARVKPAQSEQIVGAIEKNGGNVTYVLYPDEGHEFARAENRMDFYARTEAFLGKYLSGRVEPMAGTRHAGSSAVVRASGGATKQANHR